MPPNIQVQSYALVLVVDRRTLAIRATSSNARAFLPVDPEDLLDLTLHDLFDQPLVRNICEFIHEDFPAVVALQNPEGWSKGDYQAVVATVGQELVLEIEERRTWPHSGDYSARLNDFTYELESNTSTNDLLQVLCDGLTFHFAYDRAIVLQFDESGNGIVTHEAKKDELPSLLDVRFVTSDVPATSRRHQVAESVMNFVSVDRPLVDIRGEVSAEVEEVLRQYLAAREPNPNFIKYLEDSELKTLGHLSLIIDGKLWGSVYMHGVEPVYIDYQMRSFLRVAGRVAQQKIGYHIYHRSLRMRRKANSVRDRLYDQIVYAKGLAEGLTEGRTTVLDLIRGTRGAVICSEDEMTRHGACPTEEEINGIMRWMKAEVGDTAIWHTDHLCAHYPPAKPFVRKAAGMMFLPLDPAANQWIIWFKPETVQTVRFGSHAGERGERQFAINEQTRRQHSTSWSDDDIGSAQALQFFIQKTVMERYTSTRRHNALLQEALEDLEVFSYTIGHDLRAPLRGISSYAEILREDFSSNLGQEGIAHLSVIQQNADRMRVFMDDLLALSRIDRSRMVVNSLSVSQLVDRVLADFSNSSDGRPCCTVQPDIPDIAGDRNHLVTVFTNLLSNAFKYSAHQAVPRVEVGFTGERRNGFPVFYVSDNGIGIPPDQHRRIFDLFTRSTNSGDFEGTGIGLALVDRIIRYHEGEVWIDEEVQEGTRVLFYTGVAVND
ncbi:sensor histidine kinase [Lewinella sp. IMCC34183]|uniref:sensor histidine kinase n=1 Tax=Lewinella sp. IMCC34183 TaxID=2248762 RepID=UPI0018E5980A|nr:ATP-binding protein [Lewinella sp. IMCC34183]